MTLVKFTPLREAWKSQNRIDQMFDSFFGNAWRESEPEVSSWVPQVDVEETKDAFKFHADLPGVGKKDIAISVENDRLTIKGERRSGSDEKTSRFHRVERTYGSFCRSFQLPVSVLADRVEASYKEGVLEITVPKAEEIKPREIEIKS
jgi:HSP20 family protein